MLNKIVSFFRFVYDKALEMSNKKHALSILGALSFAESSFFPIPPDLLLFAVVLSNKAKALKAALVCTLGSVLGGIFGYMIGSFIFHTAGMYIIEQYGYAEQFHFLQAQYAKYGLVAIFFAGLTPFPYKIITISSGFLGVNLWSFVLVSILSRGIRFCSVSWLTYKFGDRAKKIIDKYFAPIALVIGTLISAVLVWFIALSS